MIVVLADDLSGAAELAGAALNHGLRAEVQSAFTPETEADVICVDTDSRSLPATEAARVVGSIALVVAAARPAWIYKKCDSVLRGNVLAEIRAIQVATRQAQATLISANPSRGRIIRSGEYFVDGKPLPATSFANDPEHPRWTSSVAELLGGDLCGVRTPDAATAGDLNRHAATLAADTLPVGGVEFFEAILRNRKGSATPAKPLESSLEDVTLMICGSVNSWERRRAQAAARGISALTMPFSKDDVGKRLAAARAVLLGIGHRPDVSAKPPRELAIQLARNVTAILPATGAGRLMLEGGATAAAVLRELGWSRLRACQATAPGIGALKPACDAPLVLIKPGSYEWPEELWPAASTGGAK